MTNILKHQFLTCDVTGHPCGTDTITIGQPCQCKSCRAAARIAELEAALINEQRETSYFKLGYEAASCQFDALIKRCETVEAENARLREALTPSAKPISRHPTESARVLRELAARIEELEAENERLTERLSLRCATIVKNFEERDAKIEELEAENARLREALEKIGSLKVAFVQMADVARAALAPIERKNEG